MPANSCDIPRSEVAQGSLTLDQRVSTAGYAAGVNDIAVRIAGAVEQPEVLALLRQGIKALGVDQAIFLSFVRDDTAMSSCRFLLACDPHWCQRYLDAGGVALDPWLAYAANRSEVVVARTLGEAKPEQQRLIDLAAEHGFRSVVLAPAHSGAGHSRISLLCLGSSIPGYFEAEGFAHFRIGARSLALELHEWWLARIRRELIVKANITPSDLVLLGYQQQGLSSKRIASNLQVSKSSINSRFQRMNVKLGVPNRRMAARLAVECGLIRG
jgi:DNA-binding NarL/FixJ family response regulator